MPGMPRPPGTLPVLNEEAVRFMVKAGTALNCRVNYLNKFDRKTIFILISEGLPGIPI